MLGLPFRGCWGFGWKEAGKAPDTLTLMAPVENRPSHCRGDQKGTSWKGGGPRRSWGAVRTTSDCISLAQQAAQPPTHLLCLVLNFSGTGIPFFQAGDLAQSESGACSPPLGGLGPRLPPDGALSRLREHHTRGASRGLNQRNSRGKEDLVTHGHTYGCESWTIKHSPEELMLLNCGVGEDS